MEINKVFLRRSVVLSLWSVCIRFFAVNLRIIVLFLSIKFLLPIKKKKSVSEKKLILLSTILVQALKFDVTALCLDDMDISCLNLILYFMEINKVLYFSCLIFGYLLYMSCVHGWHRFRLFVYLLKKWWW